MELRTPVEERLARVEQKLHDLKMYMTNDLKTDIEKLEDKFENKAEDLEEKFAEKANEMGNACAVQFRWTIVTLLSIFTILTLLILGLCVK